MLHTAGTPLTVASGQTIAGWGNIGDPVNCAGTVAAAGAINLNNGVMVSGAGSVTLGGGSLTVEGPGSGISGGMLATSNQYIGYNGAGTFAQSGGSNGSGNLYLGYNSGTAGVYSLSGTAVLNGGGTSDQHVCGEFVGYGGSGVFNQSGGTNTITGNLSLGYNSGIPASTTSAAGA